MAILVLAVIQVVLVFQALAERLERLERLEVLVFQALAVAAELLAIQASEHLALLANQELLPLA
jgi:hypothetical protein